MGTRLDFLNHNTYDAGIYMRNRLTLGEFEQVVLLAILRLGENAYGAAICREIAGCTRRDPAPGAMYTTLDRLEAKGLVDSRFGDPTPERGGRAKRYFHVTPRGRSAIVGAQRSYRRLMSGLRLFGGADA